MIDVRFNTEALTRVRFAISPMFETIASLKALNDPARGALHLTWVEQTRRLTADLDLSTLRALQGSPTYNPDFINPPPSGPLAEFEDELAVMLATPPEQIQAEVGVAYRRSGVPSVLQPFLTEPSAAVERLTQLLRAYWDRALEPHWGRIRSLLEHDVLYRARQMANGGTSQLFADLDPSIRWRDDVLHVDQCDHTT